MQDKLMTSSYSPVLTTKAVKDETEQRILRDAHVRDLCTLTTAPIPKQNLFISPGMKPFTELSQPLAFVFLPVGERRRRCHPAADVAGESSPTGDGDRADGRRIRQQVSQVSNCKLWVIEHLRAAPIIHNVEEEMLMLMIST